MEFGARQWADHCEKQAARIAQLEAAVVVGQVALRRSATLLQNLGVPGEATRTLVSLALLDEAEAATPADAGRRWEAMREVCKAARAYCADDGFQGDLCDALARLDAEGK